MGGRAKIGIELKISCSDTMLNYRLSQKFKLLGNDEFNHLTIILTLPLTCWPKFPLNKWGPSSNIILEQKILSSIPSFTLPPI